MAEAPYAELAADATFAKAMLSLAEADADSIDVRKFLFEAVMSEAAAQSLNYRMHVFTMEAHAVYRDSFQGVMVRRVNDFFRDGEKISKRPAIDNVRKKGGDHE